MGCWRKVNPDTFAVAIQNYPPSNTSGLLHGLDINIGEIVQIDSQTRDWYYGFKVTDKHARGMFPKRFVSIRPCAVQRIGGEMYVNISDSPIVHEITQTLREWSHLWKQLYLSGNDEAFKFIEVSMRTLLELRSQILSGNLPLDQLKKMERTAVYTMDKGNRSLGLDLIVRSSVNGTPVDPFEISTCQLNALYSETNSRIEKILNPSQTASMNTQTGGSTTLTGYRLFASIRNFVVKMTEDAELLLSLYDGVTNKQITENYVVRWSRTGFASDIDQMNNLKVLFTDLGKSDLKREKVYLVCLVIRIGGMEAHSTDNSCESDPVSCMYLPRISNRRASVSTSMSQAGKMLSSLGVSSAISTMRRPFGVAAMDITSIISGNLEMDEKKQNRVPFIPCEKENLDTVLKKIITNKDLRTDNKTGHGLYVSVKLIQDDVKQDREDFLAVNAAIARKMGFPEVIMPGDARNDLYITLVNGSFSKGGGKSTDRNIEVTVRVCDKHGKLIPGVIWLGGGTSSLNEYNSIVYHHDDRPKWHETFKICVPIDEFKSAHVLFLFRHRSSNEAKDRSSGHFALAYTKLLKPDGTTLPDNIHKLAVYKIESKKWPSNEYETSTAYLSLASLHTELPPLDKEVKSQKSFLTLVPKDYFTIETKVCSTKLTQNVELLGVLNWVEGARAGVLKESLIRVRSVPGDEAVKFLQDLLDALFNILTQVDNDPQMNGVESEEESYDTLVYECLLYVFTLVSDMKYQHFQSVLDVYIEKSFFNAMAYKKLINLLAGHVRKSELDGEMKTLLRSMKCLEYLIRFIVRSRELHEKITTEEEDDSFQQQFDDLLSSMVDVMTWPSDAALTSQGACLKYLPSTVQYILRVYPAERLCTKIGEMLDKLPLAKLTKQRLMTILDFVQGPLFLSPTNRCILIPHITSTLCILIQNHDEFPDALSKRTNHINETRGVEMRSKTKSVEKVARVLGYTRRILEEERGYTEMLGQCMKTLSEILSMLHRRDAGPTDMEFGVVAQDLLQTVVRATLQMTSEERNSKHMLGIEEDKDNPMVRQMVSILLDILRQMTDKQYAEFIQQLSSDSEVLAFLVDIQMILRILIERPVYKGYWADLVNVQNYVILNSFRLFSSTIKESFLIPFVKEVWQDWFMLAILYITQPSLQLEKMTQRRRKQMLNKNGDLRHETAYLINNMWFALGDHQNTFIPSLVGPFLEVSLIPEIEVRKLIIPLFYDMMECELKCNGMSNGDHKGRQFNNFENEMIDRLDELVEGGKGDTEWRALFVSLVGSSCKEHPILYDSGCQFVAIIGRLMDILLQYRDAHSLTSVTHQMQVTTHILDFYKEIERRHMYIRYAYKLCQMHEEQEWWAEAGLALKLAAELLHWSDAPLVSSLRSQTHINANTHRKLKHALYQDIGRLLTKGKMWELAVEICKELVTQYEHQVFDYYQLSDLYREMSELYNSIMTDIRQHPEYFRVAYYGQGFPEFLRNRVFVYRGKEFEKLQDFTTRLMDELPNAELMTKLETPGEEVLNSSGQYVQINAVEPMMSDHLKRLSGKPVSNQILTYYKYNNVRKFYYSRPFHRQDESQNDDEEKQDEFASLWLERTEIEISDPLPGILGWFPVVRMHKCEMCPLEVAIESMETSNKAVKALVLEYKAVEDLPLEPLTRKLNGIIEAAVMGGFVRYEKIFISSNYGIKRPEHIPLLTRLKDLIADLIPLLEFGIEIHRTRAPIQLAPLHKRMVERFEKMKEHVYANYGKKNCDLLSEVPTVTLRRPHSAVSNTSDQRRSIESISANKRDTGSSIKQAYTQINKHLHRNSFGNSNSVTTSPRGSSVLLSQKQNKRKDKEKRTRKSDLNSFSSQWYDKESPTSATAIGQQQEKSVFELRQELTPSRPLRSEVDYQRRFSQRPNSIQSGTNSNRNSVGTTDSNQDDDDANPPPLPQKSIKLDNNNQEELMQAVNNNINNSSTLDALANFPDITKLLASRQNYDEVLSSKSFSTRKIIISGNSHTLSQNNSRNNNL